MNRTIDISWRAVVPKPKTRSFIVGSVGSGKSTIGGSILRAYQGFFPSHSIVIVDPKQRFFPRREENGPLFPDGIRSSNHGRRDGVTVNASILDSGIKYKLSKHRIFIIQEPEDALEWFDWIFAHHDVRKPVMIYLDESFDFIRGVRADWRLRRLYQMGRELGIGIICVNQRPAWVDATFISEADRLYIGMLHNIRDRKRLADTVAIPNAKDLLQPMKKYTFYMVNQVRPESSMMIRLKG